jgi:hypothetical protein
LFLDQKPKHPLDVIIFPTEIEVEIPNHRSNMTSITSTEEQKALGDSRATSPLRVLTTQVFDILSGNCKKNYVDQQLEYELTHNDIISNCNIYSTYMDQQLEYELTHDDFIRSSNMIMQAQRMLFDEDSVVESITRRTAEF